MDVPKVGVTISSSPMRCWAGCPGEVPRELILSAQQKLPFRQDQVSCWIVTQILQKSYFLFFDVALYWPWCFWGQVTKNCSYTEITEVLVHHCCYSWSFTHILCFWTLDSSFCISWALQVSITQYWLSLIYVGNVAKPSPKSSKCCCVFKCMKARADFFNFITHSLKKTPQILLCAASQCPPEDSDAPASAEELLWGVPAQFCSSQGEEMREVWMHSGHVPSKGHANLHGNEDGNGPLVFVCTQGSAWGKTSQSWSSENSWLLFLFNLCFLSGCKRQST